MYLDSGFDESCYRASGFPLALIEAFQLHLDLTPTSCTYSDPSDNRMIGTVEARSSAP